VVAAHTRVSKYKLFSLLEIFDIKQVYREQKTWAIELNTKEQIYIKR